MAKRKRRSKTAKREGQWGGLQWPLTNVPLGGLFQDLANNLGTEERSRTCMTVRGWVQFSNSGSDAATAGVLVGAKLMSVNLNDALAITDDAQGIDTSLEDIQTRQLWTYSGQLFVLNTLNSMQDITIEINVKVKIKIPATSKKAFGLLIDASVVNRVQTTGYLRAWYAF